MSSFEQHYLSLYVSRNSEKCSTAFVPLQRSEFTELFDMTIKLAGDREIRAHKCILMSRLEYFNMMFSHSWAEVSCAETLVNVERVPNGVVTFTPDRPRFHQHLFITNKFILI